MKVNIRELRKNLRMYLEMSEDVEIERHGKVIKVLSCVHNDVMCTQKAKKVCTQGSKLKELCTQVKKEIKSKKLEIGEMCKHYLTWCKECHVE